MDASPAVISLAQPEDGVALLTLDRPAARNAFDVAGWRRLSDQLSTVDFSRTKVVLLQSAVEGIFCPGADIKEFPDLRRSADLRAAMREAMQTALRQLEQIPIPVIAVIDGACVGAGVSLAMACDLRIASPRARFGVTPAKLGLIYSADDVRRLRTAIGSAEAKWLLFTAEIVDAAEALRIGLIHRLVESELLGAAGDELARSIAAHSATTHRSVKALLGALDHDRSPDATDREFEDAFAAPDAAPRIDAMLQALDRRS